MTNLDQYKGRTEWSDAIISENEALREAIQELVKHIQMVNEFERSFEAGEVTMEQASARGKKWMQDSLKLIAKYSGPSKAGSGE